MGIKVGQTFLEATKYENLSIPAQKSGYPQPPLELPTPAGCTIINLPDGKYPDIGKVDLINLIEKRASLRKYTDETLSLEEFACLLWGTQGVKLISSRPVTMRTVPSAGARHPFETYILVNRVEGLKPGLYRYLAIDHKLAHLPGFDDINAQFTEACLNQQQVRTSAMTFIWTAVAERTAWRYSERAYRYLFLDAGHVCQNLYLLAESMQCGVCAIAAYDDDLANKVLGLDGEEQFVIYIASLGKRK